MAICGKRWISDPDRICEAKAAPGLSACLAHMDHLSRSDFLATIKEESVKITGLHRDLEVHHELLTELNFVLNKFRPIDFRGSQFIESFIAVVC